MLDACQPLLYPSIPMRRFGLNPFGDNLYRLIWAPSRRIIVMDDRTGQTKTIQCYMKPFRPIGEAWIIESWKSCYEYVGAVTEEQWNADPSKNFMGPYPKRGVYEHRETLSCNPSDASVEKIISWLEDGSKRDPRDNAAWCLTQLERELKDRKNKQDALIRDSMRPWGAESYAANGGGRNSKTYPLLRSREECRLPGEGVTKAVRPRKKVMYKVMTE